MNLNLSRREVLKLTLLFSGSVALSSLFKPASWYGGDQETGISERNRNKEVWSWLRMFSIHGDYSIPSSEKTYLANLSNIDVAMPTNGGTLQADGTWLQEPWKIDPDWPQNLPRIARDAGQRYFPIVTNDREGYLNVLDDPDLQSIAVKNLIALATTERFDSPWDGILLDFESTPVAYRQQLIDFYYQLFYGLEPTGIPVGISVACRVEDNATHDFSVIAELADFVDLRCYGYPGPEPKSIGPYWWIDSSIRFALAHGIKPENLILGLGNFAKYWPNSTQYDFLEITFDTALQIVAEAGSTIEWIESNENGLIRELYAPIEDGHIWIHNGDSYSFGLDLIDHYQLAGVSHFAAGMGDDSHWHKIAKWRRPYNNFLPFAWKSA